MKRYLTKLFSLTFKSFDFNFFENLMTQHYSITSPFMPYDRLIADRNSKNSI